MKFSIVIPNWNGRRLLEKNLSAVLNTGADELVISDDSSTDDSVIFIKKNFPQVKVIKHKRLGFAGNCNQGVKAARGDIVVLLNTDVVPEKDFLRPLKKSFQDPKVFAVSLHEPQWSWAKGKWVKGFVEHEPGSKAKETHISFWASGGSAAFRKKIWDELGGFDEIYKPFYWEDIDLSYRAWKRGYKIVWEPRSIVHHRHQATISTHFSQKYVDFISKRNQLLFIWKNITNLKMVLQHTIWLFWRLRQPFYWHVFFGALTKIPQLILRRLREIKEAKVSDRVIFGTFKD